MTDALWAGPARIRWVPPGLSRVVCSAVAASLLSDLIFIHSVGRYLESWRHAGCSLDEARENTLNRAFFCMPLGPSLSNCLTSTF